MVKIISKLKYTKCFFQRHISEFWNCESYLFIMLEVKAKLLHPIWLYLFLFVKIFLQIFKGVPSNNLIPWYIVETGTESFYSLWNIGQHSQTSFAKLLYFIILLASPFANSQRRLAKQNARLYKITNKRKTPKASICFAKIKLW